jgi:gamma-glutamylcyclotransferase (GGCT)/AIG2-like uncharacterized protein YtfP
VVKVFVYGTLKPGEVNYPTYCADKVVAETKAMTKGLLYHLPKEGYPAIAIGDGQVSGYLLEFQDSETLKNLDKLEDYDPFGESSQNFYTRQEVEIYSFKGDSLGFAWAYFMSMDRICELNGVFLVDGWWLGRNFPIINNSS